MGQIIGNVGVLDLTKATEESIQGIDEISNAGVVLYRPETAHFLTRLNIGNIGKSKELPEGAQLHQGVLTIDKGYLASIKDTMKLFIIGVVIFDKNIDPEQISKEKLMISGIGKVYAPSHLSGAASSTVTDGTISVSVYEGAPPRIENGEFTLTNTYLDGQEEKVNLLVNGVLKLARDLDMKKFNEKLNKLEVNGVLNLYAEQETEFYRKKADITGVVEVTPAGYEVFSKLTRINSRSVRRFKSKKVFTKRPIIFEADVTRELISKTFTNIQTSSYIVCHESLEDIMYEITNIEAEILPYEHSFVLIRDDETWSNEEFLALEKPVNFIVDGQLTLQKDVKGDVLKEKVAAVDVLSEIIIQEKQLKGSLQSLVRVNTGRIIEAEKKRNGDSVTLKNVGELSL
ncbi:hypothetical protein [Evansella clarkii]|uniref:hypothetical protein n=1 Tax=Evansella clarkii TaxID=79879 RepID=UPI000B43B9A8|nr:hypothetical protein [Evansella clarkii]